MRPPRNSRTVGYGRKRTRRKVRCVIGARFRGETGPQPVRHAANCFRQPCADRLPWTTAAETTRPTSPDHDRTAARSAGLPNGLLLSVGRAGQFLAGWATGHGYAATNGGSSTSTITTRFRPASEAVHRPADLRSERRSSVSMLTASPRPGTGPTRSFTLALSHHDATRRPAVTACSNRPLSLVASQRCASSHWTWHSAFATKLSFALGAGSCTALMRCPAGCPSVA